MNKLRIHADLYQWNKIKILEILAILKLLFIKIYLRSYTNIIKLVGIINVYTWGTWKMYQ